MSGIPFIFWIIYSAFSVNLVLQCGLGINTKVLSQGTETGSSHEMRPALIKLGIIFVSVILLWCVFSYLVSSVSSSLFIYIILFPVSFIVYEGLEYLFFNLLIKKKYADKFTVNFPGGVTAAALFICMLAANRLMEVIALSFGFTFGIFLVFIIIREIRKRAALEEVPRFLSGKPLLLISLGLLSLVFTGASLLVFRVIGN